jgi:hypothetical protein
MEARNNDKTILHGGFTMKRTMRRRIRDLKVANFEGAHKFNTERTAAVDKQKAKIAAEAALKKGKKTGWFGIRKSANSLESMRKKINTQTEKQLTKANTAAKRAIYHQLKLRAKLVKKTLSNDVNSKLPDLNIGRRSKKLKGEDLNEKLQSLRSYVGQAESVVSAKRASEAAEAAKAIEEPRKLLYKNIESARAAQDEYRLATVKAEQAKQKINKMTKGDYFQNEYLKRNKTFEEYQIDLERTQSELETAERIKLETKAAYEGIKKTLPQLKQLRKDMYAAENRFRATTIPGLESKLAGVKRKTPRGPILSRKLAEKARKAAKSTATTSTKSAENIAKASGDLLAARKKVEYNTKYTTKRVLAGDIAKRTEDTVESMISGKNIDEQRAIMTRFEKYAETKRNQSEGIDSQIENIKNKMKELGNKHPDYEKFQNAINQLSDKKLRSDIQANDASIIQRRIEGYINRREKLNDIYNFIRTTDTIVELEKKNRELQDEFTQLGNKKDKTTTNIQTIINRNQTIGNNMISNYKLIYNYMFYDYMKKYNKIYDKLEQTDRDNIKRDFQSKFGTIIKLPESNNIPYKELETYFNNEKNKNIVKDIINNLSDLHSEQTKLESDIFTKQKSMLLLYNKIEDIKKSMPTA